MHGSPRRPGRPFPRLGGSAENWNRHETAPKSLAPPVGFEPTAHGLEKPSLYPLSYRGVCRLVAGASQLVFRFDGIHVILSPVAMALRLPRLSPTGMMVFIARSTRMF